MTSPPITRVSFLGCGNIAGAYAKSMAAHPELMLTGVFDLDADKREEFAAEHGCTSYAGLDELCGDRPDIVVNLTTAPHHYSTTSDLIARGQTVFSEKPLALHAVQARDLVDRAARARVRLACAPSVWLAEAQQEIAALLDSGLVGTVRLVNAEVNQGRIESWHPAPSSFYQVGPVVDAGIYPITYLTAVFGPIAAVTAVSSKLLAARTTIGGDTFTPSTDDAWIVLAQFASGPLLRLSVNFYVSSDTIARNIDFHGDIGTLRLDDWIMPGSPIGHAPYGSAVTARTSGNGAAPIDWSIGLADLSAAITDGRPHRNGAEHAAHVVDVLDAVARSAESGSRVEIHSTFPSPESTDPASPNIQSERHRQPEEASS